MATSHRPYRCYGTGFNSALDRTVQKHELGCYIKRRMYEKLCNNLVMLCWMIQVIFHKRITDEKLFVTMVKSKKQLSSYSKCYTCNPNNIRERTCFVKRVEDEKSEIGERKKRERRESLSVYKSFEIKDYTYVLFAGGNLL